MQKKRKLTLVVSFALAAIMIASATYAWFTAQDSVTNKLKTALIDDGSVRIVEDFTPPTDWVPGGEVKKEVGVANDSEIKIFARIYFEEVLDKLGPKTTGASLKYVAANNPTFVPVLINKTEQENYLGTGSPYKDVSAIFPKINRAGIDADIKIVAKKEADNKYSFYPYYKIVSGDPKYNGRLQKLGNSLSFDYDQATGTLNVTVTGGSVAFVAYQDIPSALKDWSVSPFPADTAHSALDEKILFLYDDTSSWAYNELDGYFYYMKAIGKNETSTNLLKAVKLAGDADDAYQGLAYDLTVNMQAIQANVDAVKATFGLSETSTGTSLRIFNALLAAI
jgi:predicted ribosomally synthesized peptide with SipW-like signal peptide